MWKSIRENPRAVVYAVLMHLVLLIVLVFSLDWTPKITRPAGVKVPIEAKLVDQRKLDAIEEQKQAEQRKLEETKQQAEQAEQKKKEQEAKRKAEAEQKQRAEAERKKKALLAEKKKKEQEAKRKAEAEKQKQAEAKRKAEAEKKRKAEAEVKRKAEAEKQRQAEAARRREAEQALQQQLAAEQAERDQGIVAEYTAYIQEKIQQNWLKPAGSPEGLSCTVQVNLIPGGDVARVQIIRSSSDPLFDRSVENAVHKAAPMPLPRDPAVFKYFRELRLIFKPR
jgi:colicin import membrane protein